jgi:hypothetical protein
MVLIVVSIREEFFLHQTFFKNFKLPPNRSMLGAVDDISNEPITVTNEAFKQFLHHLFRA